MKIHDASYFPYSPLFYILEGLNLGYLSSINQLFSHNSEFKRLSLLRKPDLNIASVYDDDELLSFKQTYLRLPSILWGQ
jgi:hypothetical protein